MSSLTKTWSIPTSPRNPYKLINELKLLSQFEGKQWNKTIQLEFAEQLRVSDLYEGSVSAQYSDFSARDRINRAPKTFGFVRFDDDRKIQITHAGKQLIARVRIEELFLRQLLKWQYPSVKHDNAKYRENFCLKPFLEVLRIMHILNGLTKYEIALFCIPLTKFSDTECVVNEIKQFRTQLNLQWLVGKKKFIQETFMKKFTSIYQENIETGTIYVRESRADKSVENFLKTKIRNAKDYADAAIRYFRVTGLFTFSASTYRLVIADTKIQTVKDILKHTKREPKSYLDHPSVFLDYLGSIKEPLIPQDNKSVVVKEIEMTVKKCELKKFELEKNLMGKFINRSNLGIESLKDLRDILNESLIKETIKKEQDKLKDFKMLDDIVRVFSMIKDRYNDEIPDKPLFFEWNVWRALSLLNDGVIKGNLKMDINCLPLRIALGNMPDIECYYNDFVLIVEVTLSAGQRQYETEGEPVPRHIGQIVKKLRDKGDNRPVYGLFIARTLNPAVLAHFYVLRRTDVQYYGGKTKIIPLNLSDFVYMLQHANTVKRVKAKHIFEFFKWADREAKTSDNEQDWYSKMSCNIKDWTTVS